MYSKTQLDQKHVKFTTGAITWPIVVQTDIYWRSGLIPKGKGTCIIGAALKPTTADWVQPLQFAYPGRFLEH